MAYTRKHIHKKINFNCLKHIIKIIKHSTIRNKIPNNNIIFCKKFPSSNGSFKDKKAFMQCTVKTVHTQLV